MTTLVVVGSSTSRYVTSGDGRRLLVTPRDYHWMDGHVSAEHHTNRSHRDLPRDRGARHHNHSEDSDD